MFQSGSSQVPGNIHTDAALLSGERKEDAMRKLVIGIMAAGTLMAAAPAVAQVAIEGPGVGVRIGPDPYYRDYGRWDRDRGYHSYAWRERGCRTVTVRERMPDGRTVVRTRERC
jgi:hypothetical protein